MRDAFRQQGFPKLFVGLTISTLGDWMMLLVLSMWVKTLTGSNSLAGLTFFFVLVPSLFAPALGVWIDRRRRKPVLMWGHAASALVVLPLLFVRGPQHVWLIWLVGFLYGISSVVLPAALNGLLKELMAEDQLVSANAALQTTAEALRLGGPLLGAALFAAVGGWFVAVCDAVSFLVAAAIIWRIVVPEDKPAREETHLWHQVTAGVRHLVTDRVLAHTIIGIGLMLLVIGFTESSIYAILDAFGKPATFAAVVVTCQGVGAVIGGVSSSRLIKATSEVAIVSLGLAGLAVGLLVIASTSSMAVMLVAAGIIGLALPPLFVAFNTLVQRRTPQRLMGRVSLAIQVLMGTPQALSLALGALLVSIVSYRLLFLAMAVMTAAGAAHVAYWLRGELRLGGRPAAALAPTEPLAVPEEG